MNHNLLSRMGAMERRVRPTNIRASPKKTNDIDVLEHEVNRIEKKHKKHKKHKKLKQPKQPENPRIVQLKQCLYLIELLKATNTGLRKVCDKRGFKFIPLSIDANGKVTGGICRVEKNMTKEQLNRKPKVPYPGRKGIRVATEAQAKHWMAQRAIKNPITTPFHQDKWQKVGKKVEKKLESFEKKKK
jgi:hypothetical protein